MVAHNPTDNDKDLLEAYIGDVFTYDGKDFGRFKGFDNADRTLCTFIKPNGDWHTYTIGRILTMIESEKSGVR